MSTGKVLLGVLAGVAAGAAIGLLFAPEKGSETRKKLMQKGNDYAQDFKDKLNEWGKNGLEKIEGLKEDATAMVDKGRSRVEEVKRDAKAGTV